MQNKITCNLLRASIIITIALVPASVSAQYVQHLQANNLNAGIGVGGNLFTSTLPGSEWGLFETPAGSGRYEIYTAALWMTALDQGNNLHCAANQYFNYGVDFFDGPVVTTYSSAYNNYFTRVFKVTQKQLYTFSLLQFPAACGDIDSSIRYWPAKGNPCVAADFGVSIDSDLAPFVDLNQNGIYEPALGEYPCVPGEENIFFVFNDARSAHTQSDGTPLMVEIQGLAYSFSDPYFNDPTYNTPVNNTVFVNYKVINKSANTYSDYRFGLFVDPDIGCFQNDFVGCDSARNMMFAYNGMSTDPDCAPENGYGSLPVALGVKFLNTPMAVFGYFTGSATGDNPLPVVVGDYWGLERGHWMGGSPFEFGGVGYNSGGYETNYLLSGDPTNVREWSEVSNNDVPGDRQMFGIAQPQTFAPGQALHYNLAFTNAYSTLANHITIVDTLKQAMEGLERFANVYQYCNATTGLNNINDDVVTIYPNPANSYVTINAPVNINRLQVFDVQGRLLFNQQPETAKVTLPVNTLAKGIYFISIKCAVGANLKKLVIE